MTALVTWLRAVLDEDEREWIVVRARPEEPLHPPGSRAWPALGDIEAKRRIIDLHNRDGGHGCPAGVDGWGDVTGYERSCATLRLLAEAYADRPGYRDEWRPSPHLLADSGEQDVRPR